MSVRARLLVATALIVALAGVFVTNAFMEEVKPGVRMAMEDTLVDSAALLAPLVAPALAAGTLADSPVTQALRQARQTPLQARIYGVDKVHADTRVHIMDARGRVVFDSDGVDQGRDFSRWRDVALTLRGAYGARSSRQSPGDDASSVMHVAAPIRYDGALIGVLTLSKPAQGVEPYVARSRGRVLRAGLLWIALALAIGLVTAWSIARSLGQLERYAARVGAGERAEAPRLAGRDLQTLSAALATMRERLEGRHYVERYVHTLTHEMKSPLTAIAAAADLLGEDPPPEARRRFASSVAAETARLQALVERLLGLAAVEARQRLEAPADLDLAAVAVAAVAAREVAWHTRGQRAEVRREGALTLRGDAFLLRQAIGNLLDNASEFSPDGATIEVELRGTGAAIELRVLDRGAGVPDFARARLFERFYSLPRPRDGRKGTGLGLAFVREVAALHGGSVTLEPREGGGTAATMLLARRPPQD